MSKFILLVGIFTVACITCDAASTRVARSPQFGGYSQASAQSSAGSFSRGPVPPPRPFGHGPAHAPPRPHQGPYRTVGGQQGFGGPGSGFNTQPETISISKSVSITRGGAGVATSNAQSSAASGK